MNARLSLHCQNKRRGWHSVWDKPHSVWVKETLGEKGNKYKMQTLSTDISHIISAFSHVFHFISLIVGCHGYQCEFIP